MAAQSVRAILLDVSGAPEVASDGSVVVQIIRE